jgi:uncharacterized membrane protein
MRRIGILMLVVFVCFVSTAWPQEQPQWWGHKIITFDAPGAGTGAGQGSQAPGISPTGAITGYYVDASGVYHGFVRAPDGSITSFDPPNSAGTEAWSINAMGAITGYYIDSSDVFHGFLRSHNGKFTTFDAPGADLTPGNYNGTFATNINLAGVIAGYYIDSSNVIHGFLRSHDGKFTTFDAPGAGTGAYQGTYPFWASCLNPAGAITGQYVDASDMGHGFVRAPDGTITQFDGPGVGTFGTSINPAGEIAGAYQDAAYAYHSFVRAPDGKFTFFDVPGAGTGKGQGAISEGINAAGVVAANYVDANGVSHGFVRAHDGKFTFFDVPGAGTGNGQGTTPLSNNPAGTITGTYTDSNNANHGFVRLADWPRNW